MTTAQFSLVVPVYNVERYLADFLGSLSAQTLPLDQVELIFVDDGSTDGSASLIETWIEENAPRASVVSKPNGGLSSARNAGLDAATAVWVTFPDPDDVLSSNYLAEAFAFVNSPASEEVALFACKAIILDDATGELRDTHPLRYRFDKGNQVVDLDRHPHYFHIQAASAFYRRSLLDEFGLRFDSVVKPNFEDGFLTGLYLASCDRPRVGFLAEAIYAYRRREDGTSLVQGSWAKPEKYLDVTRFGYLRLLETLHARLGHVPRWAQNMVLYDLLWYFKHDERVHSLTGAVTPEVAQEFLELVTRILGYIDEETIDGYRITSVRRELRSALLIGFKGSSLRPAAINVAALDRDQQLVQVRYFYGGGQPVEVFRARGYEIEPVHAKSRSLTYFGRSLAMERIVWLPATGTLEVSLDGRRLPIELGRQRQSTYSIRPAEIWRRFAGVSDPNDARVVVRAPLPADSGLPRRLRRRAGDVKRSLSAFRGEFTARLEVWVSRARDFRTPSQRERRADARLLRRARSARARAIYGSAWVLTDRNDQAQDNAEHLYRHLRSNHPDINAWFVIDQGTPDWERLRADGFRLVSYGSDEHALLMLNADQLISSQVDHYVVEPLDRGRFRGQSWRYTFLQHGVTKDDLSRWVNGKPISLFITVTESEYQSIVADGTPYTYTTKEVKLTGFPRHDRLWRLGQSTRDEDRRLLLVMPTWRRELLGEVIDGGNTRAPLPGFWKTSYARAWTDFVCAPRLASLVEANDLEIVFVPHPNMAVYLPGAPLPRHVHVYGYQDVDIQEMFARGAMIVTDYSSNAFEVAMLHRPVVYYQFDQSTFFSGAHAYRKGTWSYEADGFGPVTTTADETIAAVEATINSGFAVPEQYLERMRSTFRSFDGKACERVIEVIRDSTRPVPYDQAYVRTGP